MMVTLAELLQGRPLTLSLAACFFKCFPQDSWTNQGEYHMIAEAFLSSKDVDLPMTNTPIEPRRDSRQDRDAHTRSGSSSVIKIYSDYNVVIEFLQRISNPTREDSELFEYLRESQGVQFNFRLVDRVEDADFFVLTSHVKDFLSIPIHQKINQFPYEGGIVRKDLLPLTVRRYCCRDGVAPFWWLPCFDLNTEFHLFCHEVRRRAHKHSSNIWISKPAQGARGKGHRLFIDQNFERMLSEVAELVVTGADKEDRVAQLLVEHPLLVDGRKCDLRVFVVVQSFIPFRAYMHSFYFARIANKPYSIVPSVLKDEEVFLTVNCYNENHAIASLQERLDYIEIKNYFSSQRPDISWDLVDADIRKLLCELFYGVRESVGSWPNSSAYYAVDIILEDKPLSQTEQQQPKSDEFVVVPKLLEVNFMGDWHGPQTAFGDTRFIVWATDMLGTLTGASFPSDRLIPLHSS